MFSVGTGTGGSSFDGDAQSYPGVPFSSLDFHQPICDIQNYGDPTEVRNCYLVGLNDLAGAKDYVQDMIAGYLQDCVDIGVVGFRVDAAKHMWPEDIAGIQVLSKSLDLEIHFCSGSSQQPAHKARVQGGQHRLLLPRGDRQERRSGSCGRVL